MEPILAGIDNTVLLALGVLLIAAAATLVFSRKRKAERFARLQEEAGRSRAARLTAARSEALREGSRPGRKEEPSPERDTDITGGCDNLGESLQVLAGRHDLESITLATRDGLVFESSGGDTAQADAALFARGAAGSIPPGVTVFYLNHKGSDLTAIIRSPAPVSPDLRERIAKDTKDILNWWL